ncbi:unnamed protein product [Acanthoscelides obtectus]|uniref:Dorsal-ventral patterning protein Sog n=1 Tax=Acanthoscelides obtectus TaxID=200917 RepID=A0A9P0PNU4_ACAOB|nr:unnamed protein product [Acanthoscelides obtectus]CAK1620755.1 Dorsal-ventral patterning protein Sog [Acanthoscelides obtectus]
MKCECVAIQRKRRIVARVQCRNIKSECPEPTCEEPVLLPGRCCKSCPGDDHNPDIIQDIVPQNVIDEEEKSIKHYAALLSGRSSLDLKNDSMTHDLNKNNVVATGRFTFHKKNLHYSFYISEKAARPRTLQFLDSVGNILEEFTLSHAGGLVNSLYQNATRKVCGVWKRLPKDYRRLLKQERMYVVLIWGAKDAEFTLSGKLSRYVALASEQFSSLLEPAPGTDPTLMAGAGGTAIVSTSSSVSPSIHVAIIFNGLFTPDDYLEVPLNITMTLDEKKQIVLQEDVRVHKPATDLNLVEVSSPVTQAQLRLISRGRILLSISSVSKPDAMRLSGNVITKATCELFQTTLASSQSEHEAKPHGTTGLAWMYLNNQGALIYSVQIDNLPSAQQYPIITLVDMSTKRRTELEDLTPNFHDGWANGTLDKLSPKILEPLYFGKLDVTVAIANDTIIHGRLTAKPVADARDAPSPILLKKGNFSLPASAVGLAWISVDNDCLLHYDVTLSGLGHDRKLELYMELYPMIAPGAPYIQKQLEEFEGNQVEGSPVDVLSKEELDRLDSGVNFLKIRDVQTQVVLLKGTVTKVKIPPSCRPSYSDNNIPTLLDHPDHPAATLTTGECFFEDKFYKIDTSWVSSKNSCKMCFCQNGVPKCDYMTCPELNCPNNNKTHVIGECCPVCGGKDLANDSNHKCFFNGRTYSPGSKFHPFLIPIGFDLCTECTCDPKYFEIKCNRLNDNEKSCTKHKAPININDQLVEDERHLIHNSFVPPRKEVPTKPADLIIKEGGCRNLNNPLKPYQNGSSYHPFIGSLGEYKCVTCKCQNGNQTCQRQQCDWSTCKMMFEVRKERKAKKMSMNYSEFCCRLKDCRKLRHSKNRSSVSRMVADTTVEKINFS